MENIKLLPFKEWVALLNISPGYGRKLLFNGKKNGLDSCVIRLGRKILIDESKFAIWLERYKSENLEKNG